MKSLCTALALVGMFAATRAATPADPQASREARNVLNWLESLSDRKDNKVISGQYHQAYIDTIHAETRRWVGLLGDELINARGPWLDDSRSERTRQQMLDWWKAGGIITVHIPIHNPKTKDIIADRDFSPADMDAVITPGTEINRNFNVWLDRWSVHAQWLQEHHVPLIIRPLHEMNCCFWYGTQPPDKTIALWKYIFNYLTRTKGLHNLLFGYAVVEFKGNFTLYYPGSEWVDLVGIDLYCVPGLTGDRELTSDDFDSYRALEALGKPIALAEFGPRRAVSKEPGKIDYRKLITGIRKYAPKIVYWFSWSSAASMRAENSDYVRELLDDPWVITRDEIPNLK